MTRAFLLALTLLPAACLPAACARPDMRADARADTVEQTCARQAEDDPAVEQFIIKGAGNPSFAHENSDRLAAAKQDATVACLKRRGIVARGGVERQRP